MRNVVQTVCLAITWRKQVNVNVAMIAVTQLFSPVAVQECLAVAVAEQQLQQNKSTKVADLIQT
jgi:hypothetical protein